MEAAQIDLVPESVATLGRDAAATHVPHAMIRAMLVTVTPLPSPRTVAELVAGGLRIDVVRGADYGTACRALLEEPGMKGRITESTDPEQALRKLMAGRADAAVLAPGNLPEPARRSRRPVAGILS
jgi:ABC-type amino acid transport substrate-binding protein